MQEETSNRSDIFTCHVSTSNIITFVFFLCFYFSAILYTHFKSFEEEKNDGFKRKREEINHKY